MEPHVYQQMARIQEEHWWYEGRRRVLKRKISALNLRPGSSILEAGCGPGANLNMLGTFGKVYAFDPSDWAIEQAARKSTIAATKGSLPFDVPFEGPFDLIAALDVIEHVQADQESLRELRKLLTADGYAVFTVPAYQFMWSVHDDVNHHVRRYTKAGFRELLRSTGYEIDFISYYNTFLFPLIAAIRLGRKVLGLKGQNDDRLPRCSFINELLLRVFAFEARILTHLPLPFGVSIFAICRPTLNGEKQ